MRFLVFTLYSPLGSFGEIAVGERRMSWARPGRSAVLGLVAAALGYERTEEAAHQELGRRLVLRGPDGCSGTTAHRLSHRADSESPQGSVSGHPQGGAGIRSPQHGALPPRVASRRLFHRGLVAAPARYDRSRCHRRCSAAPVFRALRGTQGGAARVATQSRVRRSRYLCRRLCGPAAECRRTSCFPARSSSRYNARRDRM